MGIAVVVVTSLMMAVITPMLDQWETVVGFVVPWSGLGLLIVIGAGGFLLYWAYVSAGRTPLLGLLRRSTTDTHRERSDSEVERHRDN